MVLDGEVASAVCGLTREEDDARLVDESIEDVGRIGLLAPFAGVIQDGRMVYTDRETGNVSDKMTLEPFQTVIDTNLTGAFPTVRECTQRMID